MRKKQLHKSQIKTLSEGKKKKFEEPLQKKKKGKTKVLIKKLSKG